MTDLRLELAYARGIHAEYYDQMGVHHVTPVDTAVALLKAMGIAAETEDQARTHLAAGDGHLPWDIVFEAGTAPWLDIGDSAWVLTREDGTVIEGQGAGSLPELPLGIHRLVAELPDRQQRITLLAAPVTIPLPKRGWGMTAPLYALSKAGIGAYGDLLPLVKSLGAKGGGFLGMNPVHAGFPADPGMFSPYSPSHRRRLNILHLDTRTGRTGPLVDHRHEAPLRLAALRKEFDAHAFAPAFLDYLQAEGRSLETFALHQALSDIHGPSWSTWPEELQHPDSPAAEAARAELREEILFHSWLQWKAETALAEVQAEAIAAGMSHGLYLDLAVGTHPHGAETWEDRDSFAFGASLGAPPDAFSADGQNWGLAPFNPIALRDSAYAALSETFARQLKVAGMLRVDHILGFERTFWVPESAGEKLPGSYVTMPRDSMLAVARIEAARAGGGANGGNGGIIIGEDLGNIPDGLRGALAGAGVLGCRVAMFERWNWQDPEFKPAEAYDEAAIASFSTHDLPTWQGWRQGADITARRKAGGIKADQEDHELAHRAREVAAIDRLLPDPGQDALHDFLAKTPSRLVAVQAEVILGMVDQQNLPGTTEEYPNWRLRLPEDSTALACDEMLERVATIMRQNDR
ncbi:4-alpha-glucanotransferase [Celeribacter neptunius]|uniref:4-alpha-glucanotransferase n=1 Tax=Celeribacter neptunius TaxID=588602 RepID=A0A1I3NDT2_9RHOB|nr:4-alpha-glucanotransferase [Celeribacter neptunius]SFJ07237.1 4-alpha-glucanotransferase [Celeribacter neptunius]